LSHSHIVAAVVIFGNHPARDLCRPSLTSWVTCLRGRARSKRRRCETRARSGLKSIGSASSGDKNGATDNELQSQSILPGILLSCNKEGGGASARGCTDVTGLGHALAMRGLSLLMSGKKKLAARRAMHLGLVGKLPTGRPSSTTSGAPHRMTRNTWRKTRFLPCGWSSVTSDKEVSTGVTMMSAEKIPSSMFLGIMKTNWR
jgi:hypothetical protein